MHVVDKFATIDEYVASMPEDVQDILEQVRRTIRNAAPGSAETIKYQMPTITLDGSSLVHFAAWKHHLGIYPLPDADAELDQELAAYRTEKGTGKFPYAEFMPYDLIARAVKQLVTQHTDHRH